MKIILIGACGRMGKAVAARSAECGVQIVCGVDAVSAELPFPLYKTVDEVTEQADGVIDFSSGQCLKPTLAYCKKHNLPVLLAATGYTQEDLNTIADYAKTVAVFKTGNLSLGVNLLQMLVKKAAAALGETFDTEIVERHHNRKKDAPSGTALMLAQSVKEGRKQQSTFVYGRQGLVGERNRAEIGIHAVRGGTIVGEHEVMFAGEDEIITLSHSARSRNVFANGALRAIGWLKDKPAGLYDMFNLLGEIL